MPADVIRPQLRTLTLGRLLDLKRIWGVSMQALIERAYHLKVLTPERRTALYKQLSKRTWRKQEPGSEDIAPELPRLGHEIGNALMQRGLTADEIATFTGFSRPLAENPFIPPSRHLRRV